LGDRGLNIKDDTGGIHDTIERRWRHMNLMEALVMLLSAQMPIDAMADFIDEHDTRLWRGS
jgi:hypothetical protein